MSSWHHSFQEFEDKIKELDGVEQFENYLKLPERSAVYRREALSYLHERSKLQKSENQHVEVISLALEANRLAAESNSSAAVANTIANGSNRLAKIAICISILAIIVSVIVA